MRYNASLDGAVEIEANYYLMKVFNAINEEKTSAVFVYKDVRFWRDNHSFVVHKAGVEENLGTIVDFDAFRIALGV